MLQETYPFFGIITEEQVGVDPHTGRVRIASEVLQGMRDYLLAVNRTEKGICE